MTEYSDGSLWLSFRLDGMDYCILSDYIESIAVPDKIEPVPDSPPSAAGIMRHGGGLIGVIELREIFGRMSLQKYIDQFGVMREMHISWVEDLERYVREGGEFTKPVDPHKCKFGLWYDQFETDHSRLSRLLKRIAAPHERIHHCGAEIMELRAKGGDCQAQIEAKLAEAQEVCHDDMIPLLDQLIDVYRSANRGVILVVNDGTHRAGLLADEVRNLIPCQRTRQQDFTGGMPHSPYLRELILDGENALLELDVERLLGLTPAEKAKTCEEAIQ